MPRKSAASLTVAPLIRREPARLTPPSHLAAEERDVWIQTVNALPAKYLPVEVAPLLERFCVHVARARLIETMISETDMEAAGSALQYADLAKLSRAETAAVAALARALRISNQSRLKAETAHTAAASHAAKLDAQRPWESNDSDLIPGLDRLTAPLLKA